MPRLKLKNSGQHKICLALKTVLIYKSFVMHLHTARDLCYCLMIKQYSLVYHIEQLDMFIPNSSAAHYG